MNVISSIAGLPAISASFVVTRRFLSSSTINPMRAIGRERKASPVHRLARECVVAEFVRRHSSQQRSDSVKTGLPGTLFSHP